MGKPLARSLNELPNFSPDRTFIYSNCGLAFDRQRLQIAFAFFDGPTFQLNITAVRQADLVEVPAESSSDVKRYKLLFLIADDMRPEVETLFGSRREAMQALEIVKQMYEAERVQAHIVNEPQTLRILFLAANPTSQSRLDLEREARDLERELRGVRFRDQIRLIPRYGISPDDLLRYVEEEQPNVVHFSGHGSKNGIIFRADDSNDFHVVRGDDLRRFFEDRGVDLVVLNACYSVSQAQAIQASVPAVVGTGDAVGDEAARRFTVAFYRSLGNGMTVRRAFRSGTDAVRLYGLQDVFHSMGGLDQTLVA